MQVPNVLATVDERLRLLPELVHRVRNLSGRQHQLLDGRRLLGAEPRVLGLQLGLELVPGREELGLLLVPVDPDQTEFFGVELRSLENVRPGQLRSGKKLLLRLDQSRQQPLELVDDG